MEPVPANNSRPGTANVHQPSRIELICFEIGQDPRAKTDYMDMIRHEESEPHIRTVRAQLWEIHRSLSQKSLKSEALIYFPISTRSQPLFCLCKCKTVSIGATRPFLRLQAVAGSLGQLEQARVDPLSLYYTRVWERMEQERPPFCKIDPALLSTAGSITGDGGMEEMKAALLRPEPGLVPLEEVDYGQAVALARQAVASMTPAQQARVSLAIGVPEGVLLPTRPQLLVPLKESSRVAPAIRDPIRASNSSTHRADGPPVSTIPSPERANAASPPLPRNVGDQAASLSYPEYLERLASRLEARGDLSLFQRLRLWNQCQDLIALAEEVENGPVEDGPVEDGSLEDGREQQKMLRAASIMAKELARWGAAGEASALEAGTTRFSEGLAMAARAEPAESPDARGDRSSSWSTAKILWSVILAAVFFGAGYLSFPWLHPGVPISPGAGAPASSTMKVAHPSPEIPEASAPGPNTGSHSTKPPSHQGPKPIHHNQGTQESQDNGP